jgi:PPOX class probable F420-dependent enzyme
MAKAIPPDVQAFLAQPHVAAFATVRPDGRPHVTPVWYDFDGEAFTVSTFRNAQKLTNVSKKGFASLCVYSQEPPYLSVIVEGTARVGSPVDTVWREKLAVRYLGEHAGRVYVQETADWDMIAIHVRPLRWTSTGFAESQEVTA